jgi:hypothetical protein
MGYTNKAQAKSAKSNADSSKLRKCRRRLAANWRECRASRLLTRDLVEIGTAIEGFNCLSIFCQISVVFNSSTGSNPSAQHEWYLTIRSDPHAVIAPR